MTSKYASAAELTAAGEPPMTDVTLLNGSKVKVRGLTRFELILNGKGTEDPLVIERRNVATCMVEPTMTEAAVEKWQKSSAPGDLARVTVAIRDLSGLGEGAGKSDVAAAGD